MTPTTSFWNLLPKPIFVLAPMANVTDAAFRQMIATYGKPHVMWTEFVSCDGLCNPAAREHLLIDLKYSQIERPIVAQIFGGLPDNFYRTALLLQELGFDGIDINMGCPDKTVEKQCAGAALTKNPQLAQTIIRETKRGAGNLPVSVKIRLGYNKDELETWLPTLLEQEPAAVSIHARTRKEMSNVPAHWDRIEYAVQMRNKLGSTSLIIGNGDVIDLTDAKKRVQDTGADGIMLGRAIFGNPWLFSERPLPDIPLTERFRVMIEHVRLYEQLYTGKKPFEIMKKHFKAYVNGFEGAKELRTQLMVCRNADEIEQTVASWKL